MADRVRTHDAVESGASAPAGKADSARGRSATAGRSSPARGRSAARGRGGPARGQGDPAQGTADPTGNQPSPAQGPADPTGRQTNPARDPVPVTHVRRYRRREVALADGSRLVLAADGTLTRFDAAGTPEHTWAPDDPEWPRLAIRFGLRSQPRTVTPAGRFVEAAKLTRPGG